MRTSSLWVTHPRTSEDEVDNNQTSVAKKMELKWSLVYFPWHLFFLTKHKPTTSRVPSVIASLQRDVTESKRVPSKNSTRAAIVKTI